MQRASLVDTQVARFGAKAEYETRVSDQLIYNTQGDPLSDGSIPKTDNVGRMQQYTNTLEASLQYGRELGLNVHANFGASACYPDSPLQGDFSRNHPEWMRGAQLRFEVPEVRAYALRMIRECLDAGAPGISIDFMRYPQTIDKPETCNTFLRELRELTEEYSRIRGKHVPVLVQFPGKGVLPPDTNESGSWDLFHFATWAREGLIDYLCPQQRRRTPPPSRCRPLP